ncbi:MAG: hypothetical protein H6625_14075 [Bdellovibrionaceae bacterium]|nr:hypothetical protein [Pseudobdellovibrionaceae bacterium]
MLISKRNILIIFFLGYTFTCKLAFSQVKCDPEATLGSMYHSIVQNVCYLHHAGYIKVQSNETKYLECSFVYALGALGGGASFWAGKKIGGPALSSDFKLIENNPRNKAMFTELFKLSRDQWKDGRQGRQYLYREILNKMDEYPNRDVNLIYNSLHHTDDVKIKGPLKISKISSRFLTRIGSAAVFAGLAGFNLAAIDGLFNPRSVACDQESDKQYMKFADVDRDNECKIVKKISPKTIELLSLDSEDQIKILKENRHLCQDLADLSSYLDKETNELLQPEHEVLSCNENNEPNKFRLKWADKSNSEVSVQKNGDLVITSDHNKTQTYLVDMYKEGDTLRMSDVTIRKSGFADQEISPLMLTNGNKKYGVLLKNELAFASKNAFVTSMLTRNLSGVCDKFMAISKNKNRNVKPATEVN